MWPSHILWCLGVAYLTVDAGDTVHISFVMARSRVSPKRQQSITRLELCAALAGAQLSKFIQTEMILPIWQRVLWSDSITVLEWIQSDSCRYKVFVGTCVSETQEVTDCQAWRYIDSPNNSADYITRGKPLLELTGPGRWCQGPTFLKQKAENWPNKLEQTATVDLSQLKGITFCCLTAIGPNSIIPDVTYYNSC